MDDFGIGEMLDMQKALQERYKGQWETISPETGKNKLLWMVGEIGEVSDILKKHGAEAACQDLVLRASLVEELADVLMYYNDVLLCYGISAADLKRAIRQMSFWDSTTRQMRSSASGMSARMRS